MRKSSILIKHLSLQRSQRELPFLWLMLQEGGKKKNSTYIHKTLIHATTTLLHFYTLRVFLQIICYLHERNLMNSFEMHPGRTIGAERQASWEIGGAVQPPSLGAKAPPRSRWEPQITQWINSNKSSSAAEERSSFQVPRGATAVDWILSLQSTILKWYGQTGNASCLLEKSLVICSSLLNEN